jgi:hypothetical protein
MVDMSQENGWRARADILDRPPSDDVMRPLGMRFLLAVGTVLAIVTFTLTSVMVFYSGSF